MPWYRHYPWLQKHEQAHPWTLWPCISDSSGTRRGYAQALPPGIIFFHHWLRWLRTHHCHLLKSYPQIHQDISRHGHLVNNHLFLRLLYFISDRWSLFLTNTWRNTSVRGWTRFQPFLWPDLCRGGKQCVSDSFTGPMQIPDSRHFPAVTAVEGTVSDLWTL